MKFQTTHVRDVKHPDSTSTSVMLLDDRRILDWHRPTTELHHSSPMRSVPIMERSFSQFFGGHGLNLPKNSLFGEQSVIPTEERGQQFSPSFLESQLQRSRARQK